MYKPKYLTREFVVYRDPKLDPRSEMQAGGVVQREGFEKGSPKSKPTRKNRPKPALDRLSDALLNAYAKDDIRYLIMNSGVGDFSELDRGNVATILLQDENAMQYVSKNSGLSTEEILDLIDDRDAYSELEKASEGMKRAAETRLGDQRKFYQDAEQWIMKNAKRYDDPAKFKKAFKRTFPKNNYLLNTINSKKTTPIMTQFSDGFKREIFGTGEGRSPGGKVIPGKATKDISRIGTTPSVLDDVFRVAIYNFNPTVRNKIRNEFMSIIPKGASVSDKQALTIKTNLEKSKLLKQFGLDKKIKGPISRLILKDLGENLFNSISEFRKPFQTVESTLIHLKDKVNPKYREAFKETLQAVRYAKKSLWNDARKQLNIAQNINFDHKIPKALIDAGYADEINYIKLTPVTSDFNTKVKNTEFDRPLIKLTKKYELASPSEKSKIFKEIQSLKDSFNKKTNGYLDDLTITEKKGKLIFDSKVKPLTRKTDVVSELVKNFERNPQLFQLAESSFGGVCRVKKSAGGRIPGEDYNACIARNFNETVGDVTSTDDAKRVKATTKLMQMGRGAAKLGKGALKGLQAVLIGTGAGEIAATAVLEAAAPIYNYFEGEELERVFASAPILGFALSKIDPENFSDEALEKIVYGQGLTDEEIIDAEIVANQLRRYKKMTDLFRQRASLLEYEDQLISEGAQPGIVDDKIAEIDKQVAAEAAQFAKEGNEVTKERIMSFDKGIQNYAEETQFQKEKRFVNKYLTNPAADPMTPRDYIDRKKASLIGEFFGDLSPVDGPLYQIGQNLTPELRTIATPEVKDYYNFAEGGIVERKGFANGPKITRRGFIGAAAALIASLKLGSFGQTGKKVTTEVGKRVIKNAPKGTPDWFAPLVDKVFKEGVDAGETMKTVTSRETVKKLEVKNPETNTTESYFLYENPDTGEVRIDIDAPFLGANDGEFSLYMRPDRVDGVSDDGKPILEEGEFFVTEERAVGRSNGPDDFDIELETIDTDLSGSASDYHRVEEFATGKTDKKAQAEQLKRKDYIEKNPGDDIESRYGPYDDTPPDDYYD